MWWLGCIAMLGEALGEDTSAPAEDPSPFSASGEIRSSYSLLDTFPIDAQGAVNEQNAVLIPRVIGGVGMRIGDRSRVDFEAEWTHPEWMPRKARFATAQPWGKVSIGADTFGWGTGILAHDGRTSSHFGDPQHGNVVGRVSYAARPVSSLQSWMVFVAGDVVIRDENAEVFQGDLARQVVLGTRWSADDFEAGLLALVRWQRDREDSFHPSGESIESVAFPVDMYVRKTIGGELDKFQSTVEAELVHVRGKTDRLWNGETGPEGGQIRSLGASTSLAVAHVPSGFTLDTEFAYASGDNDAYDNVSRTFFMHSDHKMGLILFDQALPLISGRSVDLASDPDLIGQPPSGLRFTEAKGGLTNAVAIHPVLVWETELPVSLRAGWLQAWSAGDWVDVYQTAKNGGYNTTAGGKAPGSRELGGELDVGVRYNPAMGSYFTLGLVAEGGVFFPGKAFEGITEDPIQTARFRAMVQW